MKTRHTDCEFCHGEEWETVDYRSTFDGLLHIKYQYTDTGTVCEGQACCLCVDYAYSDDEIIVTYLEGEK